jgi:hypothetical protein
MPRTYGMLRMRKKPPAASKLRRGRLQVSKWTHDAALHYLARREDYGFTDEVRKQLTEVVQGYTGRCDEVAARAGIAWMRDRDRREGKTARF